MENYVWIWLRRSAKTHLRCRVTLMAWPHDQFSMNTKIPFLPSRRRNTRKSKIRERDCQVWWMSKHALLHPGPCPQCPGRTEAKQCVAYRECWRGFTCCPSWAPINPFSIHMTSNRYCHLLHRCRQLLLSPSITTISRQKETHDLERFLRLSTTLFPCYSLKMELN